MISHDSNLNKYVYFSNQISITVNARFAQFLLLGRQHSLFLFTLTNCLATFAIFSIMVALSSS